jgi:hypothetical protein
VGESGKQKMHRKPLRNMKISGTPMRYGQNIDEEREMSLNIKSWRYYRRVLGPTGNRNMDTKWKSKC